jgi:hypothetical protein
VFQSACEQFHSSSIDASGNFCNSEQMHTESLSVPSDSDGGPRKGSGLVLEVFAGSCRFSKACKELGLRVLAIDKDPKRAENFPVAAFDLTKHDFQTVCKFAETERDNICWAHFAPSCGTA